MAGTSNVIVMGQQVTASGVMDQQVTASGIVWVDWNMQYTSNQTACTASQATAQYVWAGWNQSYTASSVVTTNVTCETIWASWVQMVGNQYQQVAYEPDPVEQQRAVAAQQARERLRVEADERADRLLIAHLTEVQQKQYEKDRFFDVHTLRLGKVRRYRLTHGWAGNVFLIDDHGRRVEKFCIHPTRQVPYADNLLAQKLLLEADEDQFLRIANRTQLAA